MILSQYKKIHLIGIGGVGMSAMAKYLCHHGVVVTGSDIQASEITKELEEKYTIPIFIGVNPENISSKHDAVVYSPAIGENNIERQEAVNRNIPQYSYPELLGFISNQLTTIAVSGTNGKTTTTAMIIETMKALGMNPTGIVGAVLQKYNSNFIAGQSEYFVTEACEYKESFLNIKHDILVITNITEDHLDYFTDLKHIQNTFTKFLNNKKGLGILICNTQLPELSPIIEKAQKLGMDIIPYQKYLNDTLTLSIPGRHNLENAAATLSVIEKLGLLVNEGIEYLSKHFAGVKRRMEHIGMTEQGAIIFDDYAHNPEGLEYLISGLRDFYPDKKIVMLFEPHLYSRTRDFKELFGKILSQVDILYLFPTYRAREQHIPEEDFLLENSIDQNLVEFYKVTNLEKFNNNFIKKTYDTNYIIITVGAGDIWKVGLEIKKTTLQR